ncbi:peptidoglycan-recognition protein 2 isoform X2 [Anabrus simplex]|uniref:peptidoglycan-recognition protein 2 isoform X2 n=1 Tax=Anabrus simplex TaxID=316456 RepID=UPI0035A2CAAD
MAAQTILPRADDHIVSTVRGVGRGCTGDTEPADDPTQPLLHDPWMRSRKVHYLLLTVLGILLLGGVIIGTWLIVLSRTSGGGPPDPAFQLVNRTAWGARPPHNDTQPLTTKPAIRVVIIHTVTAQCLSLESCCKQVRKIQDLQMDDFNFSDIAYNFLVGGDGRTYEGRGWDTRGAFSQLMNSKALGIAFIAVSGANISPPAS